MLLLLLLRGGGASAACAARCCQRGMVWHAQHQPSARRPLAAAQLQRGLAAAPPRLAHTDKCQLLRRRQVRRLTTCHVCLAGSSPGAGRTLCLVLSIRAARALHGIEHRVWPLCGSALRRRRSHCRQELCRHACREGGSRETLVANWGYSAGTVLVVHAVCLGHPCHPWNDSNLHPRLTLAKAGKGLQARRQLQVHAAAAGGGPQAAVGRLPAGNQRGRGS